MRVYFDTNCIIYLLEQTPDWESRVISRIASARAAGDELAVGDLSRAECLVGPFKRGDTGLEARYRAFFDDVDILNLPVTVDALERAARLRSQYQSIKLPDALHLATAIEHRCGVFVTADQNLANCMEILVEILKV